MGKTQVEVKSSYVTTLARRRNTTAFKLHSFNIATGQTSKFVDILKKQYYTTCFAVSNHIK